MKFYIVVDEDSVPMSLSHYDDTPKSGVLTKGGIVELFRTYSKAAYAIDRTRVYAERSGLRWSVSQFKIRPAVAQ